ncbi:hypothetical protein Cgig2_015702 [Carnegiea gigantea]|uniref:DM2 domain-containing protein n=1 Tax=Carnegiea gigantea TaxID=171969 RepID=A0A9Q1GP72_9CARY|nr:hypothetical protein Cgig2_015702 [Carnegiea gigantea]
MDDAEEFLTGTTPLMYSLPRATATIFNGINHTPLIKANNQAIVTVKDTNQKKQENLANIMRSNPPFGVKGALANKFIDHALQFDPRLIILIISPETQSYGAYQTPQLLLTQTSTWNYLMNDQHNCYSDFSNLMNQGGDLNRRLDDVPESNDEFIPGRGKQLRGNMLSFDNRDTRFSPVDLEDMDVTPTNSPIRYMF